MEHPIKRLLLLLAVNRYCEQSQKDTMLGTGSSLTEVKEAEVNPNRKHALVISLSRGHDRGDTSLVYCLKIDCDFEEEESVRVLGGPFRLYNNDGWYIWQNEDLRDNEIKVGSIISYQFVKAFRSRRYLTNTGKKLVSPTACWCIHRLNYQIEGL